MGVSKTWRDKQMAVKRTKRISFRIPLNPAEVSKRKAAIAEKKEYLESLKTGKPMSDGTMGMSVENMNINAVEKEIERDEKALEHLSPHEGNAYEKRKAQLEFNEAKEYIAEHGLSLREIAAKPNCSADKDIDYNKAVEKSLNSEVGNPEFQRMCVQLKRAAGVIDPDNPDLRNVNNYRSK
jgi:hypothetical protein